MVLIFCQISGRADIRFFLPPNIRYPAGRISGFFAAEYPISGRSDIRLFFRRISGIRPGPDIQPNQVFILQILQQKLKFSFSISLNFLVYQLPLKSQLKVPTQSLLMLEKTRNLEMFYCSPDIRPLGSRIIRYPVKKIKSGPSL